MREVNFSIPNVNKASVHITTTLYDRRALDCTSTLPLINSLNHLAYLTTSSARIRDILVVDGGVERLICILKEGRSKDVMDMWKWNLAFQCVVNIGVRGSEEVRTRVVEADMVPVIATILDNYIQVIEKQRAKAEAEQAQRNVARLGPHPRTATISRPHSYAPDQPNGPSENRPARRQPPPALDIPQPFTQTQHAADDGAMEITPGRQTVLTSPPERTTFPRPQLHHHHRSHDGRNAPHRNHIMPPLATAMPSMDTADGFTIRPVRDVDRLPSMLPPLQAGNHSQPESPTTPSAPPQHRSLPTSTNRRPRRPSIRQQRSTSGDSDDAIGDESAVSGDDANGPGNVQPVVEVQAGVSLANVDDDDALLDGENAPLTLTIPDESEPQETETFNITHRNAMDSSILNTNATPVDGALTFSPVPPAPPVNIPSPAMSINAYPNFLRNPSSSPGMQAMQPRDEDVLMSLQLLAYVSKYCNLRPHFQATHLVPKLRLSREIQSAGEDGSPSCSSLDEDEDEEDEEYSQPDDFNTFPLVEKFTVRHHSKDMQYWACVVMRNLCRKDDSKGGIRQCAYYACGRWEEFTRQFAKCRRCRRTKYCSKDCQKNAWVYHRHWCHAPS
jgi:MYND finger